MSEHQSTHRAHIAWKREWEDFSYESYSRDHIWRFPHGFEVPASAAPAFRGSEEKVDPEQALVATASACHMLTFLALASRKRIPIDAYEDDAEGVLKAITKHRLAITRIVLRPRITFGGERPDDRTLQSMHERAHENCFIANSLKTEIVVEPVEA